MTYYVGSIPCSSSDVKHWGLSGMKWGVRRYRNPDGTLTEEGKVRYYGSTKKSVVKAFGDSDLDSMTRRLQKENFYIETANRNKHLTESSLSKGAKVVKRTIVKVASNAIYNLDRAAMAIGKAYIKSIYGPEQKDNKKGNKDKKDKKDK